MKSQELASRSFDTQWLMQSSGRHARFTPDPAPQGGREIAVGSFGWDVSGCTGWSPSFEPPSGSGVNLCDVYRRLA